MERFAQYSPQIMHSDGQCPLPFHADPESHDELSYTSMDNPKTILSGIHP